jgi:hypothetical protein
MLFWRYAVDAPVIRERKKYPFISVACDEVIHAFGRCSSEMGENGMNAATVFMQATRTVIPVARDYHEVQSCRTSESGSSRAQTRETNCLGTRAYSLFPKGKACGWPAC